MPTKKDKDKQSETDVAFSRPKRGTRRASEYDSDQKASPTGVADIVTPDLAPKPNIGKASLRSNSPVPETVFSSAKPKGREKVAAVSEPLIVTEMKAKRRKKEAPASAPVEIQEEPVIVPEIKTKGRKKAPASAPVEIQEEPAIVTAIKSKGRAKKAPASAPVEIQEEPAIVPEIKTKGRAKKAPLTEGAVVESAIPIEEPLKEVKKIIKKPLVSRQTVSDVNDEDFINILTPENKRNPNFKNEVAKLTRSDAHHDLKDVFKDTIYKTEQSVRAAFDSGIPVPATTAYHEGEAFAAVIINVNTEGNNIVINGEEALDRALDTVPDCTNEYNGRYSVFDVGVTGMPIFKYKVVRFVTNCSNNANFKRENLSAIACKSDFGKKFVENVKLGEDGDEAAIIVDFSQHHFIEDLTSGTKTDFQVHYLMTPEVVNDPAGKPNVNNRSLFDIRDNGVRLKSYVQSDNVTTTYTRFDDSDPSPSNNFFSNYDFTLSPIKQIFTKQKAEKLITTLNIKYDVVPGKPLTDTIEDSKGENSITTVLGYLRKLLDQVRVKNDNAVKFNFNSKIQQKRGGDWFQALCCIDARNRVITEILPTRGSPTKLSPSCPVYLVTHDRIAVSFALLNGVNVIYLDYYGRIFVFKNTGDITLKSTGKSIDEILFDGIKRKWEPNNPRADELSRLLITVKKYTTDRNSYLNGVDGKISSFHNKCDEINTSVNDFTFNAKNPIIDFQKIATVGLQKIFTLAVELEFIKTNLIDVEQDIRFIESNREIFSGDYSDEIKTKVAYFSKALNNIKGIQDRFGIIPAQGDFYNAFNNWISANVPKLDVYKCAKKILEESTTSASESELFAYDRLINFYNKNHDGERTTDVHIFLPFIQDLDDTSREKMLAILLSLTPKLEEYITISKATGSRSSSRVRDKAVGLNAYELFYNKLANLIYESFVFIEHSKATTPEAIKPVFSKTESLIEHSISTDNVLLRVDKMELDVLKRFGKHSNYTDDVADDAADAAGGGYMDSFSNASPYARNPESVVCDISVKQITWPLLTCVLLQNSDTSSITRFIDQIRENVPDVITTESEEREELDNNPIILSLIEKLRQSSSASASASSSLGGRRMRGGGFTQETYKAIINLNNLANGLYSSQDKTATGKNLMLNFKIGFHPLTPIYAMLTSYYNTLGPQSDSDPFFYTYFTYINVLEKMKSILETNYLNNTSNPYKTASSYLIGVGLCYMLLKTHTSKAENKEILDVIGMTKKDFSTFSLKNDSFTSLFSGAFHQDSDEEMIGMVCLNNKLFSNFINNQVNIKQVLEQGTSVSNLPTYQVLKDKMFKLMGEIVVKVNADRGTPITPSPTASGIPGISSEERASRAALGQQKYEENVAKGLIKPTRETGIKYGKDIFTYSKGEPSNMVSSTTSSQGTRSLGGKKKRITRKHHKAYRNKTVKRSRKHKKTRKHRRH
jgi:hypothetical protein